MNYFDYYSVKAGVNLDKPAAQPTKQEIAAARKAVNANRTNNGPATRATAYGDPWRLAR